MSPPPSTILEKVALPTGKGMSNDDPIDSNDNNTSGLITLDPQLDTSGPGTILNLDPPADKQHPPPESTSASPQRDRTGSYVPLAPTYDPTGHYTSAYTRIVNPSQSSPYPDKGLRSTRMRRTSFSTDFAGQAAGQAHRTESPFGGIEPGFEHHLRGSRRPAMKAASKSRTMAPQRRDENYEVEEPEEPPLISTRRRRSPSPVPPGFSSAHPGSDSQRSITPQDDFVAEGVQGPPRQMVRYDRRRTREAMMNSVPAYHDGSNENPIYDGEEDDIFAPGSLCGGQIAKKRHLSRASRVQFSSDDYQQLQRSPADPRRREPQYDQYFPSIGRNLAPSRYSGAHIEWGLNQDPQMVPHEEVSDAALMKRGLKRGKGDKVCRRGYGANDPENIAIVNMKENDGYSFQEIVKILNSRRVFEGKEPSLSVCGVTSRYNRTAPLLFASRGEEFVQLSKRRKGAANQGGPNGLPAWNGELDIILVQSVKEVEGQKWFQVAQLIEEKTGFCMSANAAAQRHSML